MRTSTLHRRTTGFALPVLALSLLVGVPARAADDMAIDVPADATIQSVLQAQSGKSVTVELRSGKQLSGVIRSVGDSVVHLGELRGQEFFDAVVAIDDVSAVIVRVRKR